LTHVPVLADEIVRALAGARFVVDATVGAGGHAARLLEGGAQRLLGLDRDPAALALAAERLRPFGERVTLVHGSFRTLAEVVLGAGGPADALVADLGVSSMQLDDPARGFSFRAAGPLEMRMDPTTGTPLGSRLASMDAESLADAIFQLGDERRSRRIARAILAARDAGRLETTLDLAAAVRRAHGPRRGAIDPATRTFQALRMLVNDEVGEIEALLASLPRVLAPGGRAAILSFHSIEDRLVKTAFRAGDVLSPTTKKPIRPSDAEADANPRARSAKLRVAVRSAS
jgi:16S rRNA (cytosine1402-N4)-methyltransferase